MGSVRRYRWFWGGFQRERETDGMNVAECDVMWSGEGCNLEAHLHFDPSWMRSGFGGTSRGWRPTSRRITQSCSRLVHGGRVYTETG